MKVPSSISHPTAPSATGRPPQLQRLGRKRPETAGSEFSETTRVLKTAEVT